MHIRMVFCVCPNVRGCVWKCINQTIKQAGRVLTGGPINASGNCPHTLSIYYTCPTWPGLHVMLDLMEATPSFILTKWEKALEISLVGALQVFILKTETHLLTPGLFIISLHNRHSGGSTRLALQEGVKLGRAFPNYISCCRRAPAPAHFKTRYKPTGLQWAIGRQRGDYIGQSWKHGGTTIWRRVQFFMEILIIFAWITLFHAKAV